jgi:hypothetical protein
MSTIILFAPLIGALICGFGWRFIGEYAGQVIATGLLFLAAFLSWIVFFTFDGETVRIVAGPGTRAALVVGERQLQVSAVTEGSPSTPNCPSISYCVWLWSTALCDQHSIRSVRYEHVVRAGASRGHARARRHRRGELNGQLGGVQRGADHRH